MKKFTVSTSTPYDILIGHDLISKIGEFLKPVFSPRHVCVITDSTVNGLYAQVVMTSLIESGYHTSKILFPSGEHSKNLTTYSNILEALADEGLTRSDLVLALGGGVVCDLAGFAAGTYMRGINYVVVPTTLQASIDTAIGGKTGINLLGGKNLAGVFWQPSLVVCDSKIYETLPNEILLEGIAEATKNAVIAEAGLLDQIRKHNYEYVIERCISIKKSLVEADERETSLRQLLNFGHTIGHGIEKLSSYTVTHCQAVAKGMIAEARGAYALGLTPNDISGELTEILKEFGFDTSLDYNAKDIYKLALKDKKIRDGQINIIVPDSIGKCTLRKLSLPELNELITLGLKQA